MNILRFFTKAEYTVGYRICENDLIDDSETKFSFIPRNKDEWYADPFVYFHDGSYYVFMEVMQNEKGYAGIGYSRYVDGKLTKPKIVIDTGFHYSFPFIFEYNNEIFILPESGCENNLKLFRCVEFPDKWEEYYAKPMNRALCDTVVLENKDRTYLLTSEGTEDLYGCKLFLMEIENNTLKPEILSEKMISSDYRYSRQAGKILRKEDRLIRVAQDCSNNEYGKNLEFLEIDSAQDYSEHFIKQISPKNIKTDRRLSGKCGVHTYNRVNNFDVVDFKVMRFYPKAFFIKTKIAFDILKSKLNKQ